MQGVVGSRISNKGEGEGHDDFRVAWASLAARGREERKERCPVDEGEWDGESC